ncbi:MAG: hypothetical protein NTZ38_00925 [Candidatus Taylorbacteria bacterium]|nr:hypothetical protein [Candidatus Taylorbacteria bacterium]
MKISINSKLIAKIAIVSVIALFIAISVKPATTKAAFVDYLLPPIPGINMNLSSILPSVNVNYSNNGYSNNNYNRGYNNYSNYSNYSGYNGCNYGCGYNYNSYSGYDRSYQLPFSNQPISVSNMYFGNSYSNRGQSYGYNSYSNYSGNQYGNRQYSYGSRR